MSTMMGIRKIAALVVITAFQGSCAPAVDLAASPAGRDCFNVRFLTGYEAVDRDTIRVHAGPSTEYDIDLQGGQCDTVDWAQRLAIESTPSSWICVGDQAGQGEIRFREPATRRIVQCYITDVRRAPSRDRSNGGG